jgi:hypothetical protein
MYNGLFTSMVGADEYARYSLHEKGVRVSGAPKGVQRTSHYLQLPYAYGFPLLALAATLHWLVNQSIFLVLIDGWPYNALIHVANDADLTDCGYSPIAFLFVIVLAALALVCAFLMGLYCLPGSIPIAGGCSLAISAACQWEEKGGRQSVARSIAAVKWGVVNGGNGGRGQVGHCAFSSGRVAPLVVGMSYYGEVKL